MQEFESHERSADVSSHHGRPSAAKLRPLDTRLAGDYADSDKLDHDSERLRKTVPHPDVLGLIFYPARYLDHEPTAGEIVERALAYRAIEL